MKQFEKMGWIRQGFLGLIVCLVMSPSHAMSVRERYLLNHPQATEPVVEKKSSSSHVVKHSKRHRAVEHIVPVHSKATHRSHKKTEQSLEKKSRVHQAKTSHYRAIVSKHTKSKLDKQQARDAEASLKRPRAKVKQVTHSRQKHHVAAAPIKRQVPRHAVKHKVEHRVHQQKNHRAE